MSRENFQELKLHARITHWFSTARKVEPLNGSITYSVRAREKTVQAFLLDLPEETNVSYEEVKK